MSKETQSQEQTQGVESQAGRFIRPGRVPNSYPFSKAYTYARIKAGDWRSKIIETPGSTRPIRVVFREDIDRWIDGGGRPGSVLKACREQGVEMPPIINFG